MTNRPFKDIDEMNEKIVSNMIKPLKSGDIFYFLGDMAFFKKFSDLFFKRLPDGVKFVWIVGNHDKKIPWETTEELLGKVDIQISPMLEMKIGKREVTLCHYPMRMWNKSHYNTWHLHGHCHNGQEHKEFVQEGKILNVNCEFNDFKPWSENDVIEYMNSQSDNAGRECDHHWVFNGHFEYCDKCKEINKGLFD